MMTIHRCKTTRRFLNIVITSLKNKNKKTTTNKQTTRTVTAFYLGTVIPDGEFNFLSAEQSKYLAGYQPLTYLETERNNCER